MKVNIHELGGKAKNFVIEIVKDEAKAFVKDIIHNVVEDFIMPKLREWRFMLWNAILEIWGRLYVVPRYRKIIRAEVALGIPLSGPLTHDGDFHYHRYEYMTDY